MMLSEMKDRLFVFQEHMTLAAQENDWTQLTELNSEVVKLFKMLTSEQREQLAEPIQQLRETYQNILSYSDIRREELQAEMGKLRKNKTALQNYGMSLAAGNQELGIKA